MKKLRYSTGVKAIIACLQQICSVVLVICIIFIAMLIDKNMLEFPYLKNQEFIESQSYQEIFKTTVTEVQNYVRYQKQFEDDGVYNSQKAINIMAYTDSNRDFSNIRIDGNDNEKFCYYLGDLEYWSKEYVRQQAELDSLLYMSEDGELCQLQRLMIQEEIVWESDIKVKNLEELNEGLQELLVSEVIYRIGLDEDDGEEEVEIDKQLYQVIQKVKAGKIYDLTEEELKEILIHMHLVDTKANTKIAIVEEKYLPIEGDSILKEFVEERITFSEMEKKYTALEYTLQSIGSEITAYKRFVNKYQNEMSNLQFLIYSQDNNQTYTNMSFEKIQDLLAYGKRLGSYFYYNSQDIRLDTNVDGMENFFYESMESGFDGYNSVVFVGVDTEFPYEDSFWQAKVEYNKLQPWLIVGFIVALISAMASFFSFVYLSIATGRRSTDNNTHIIWLDKIKTELWVLGFIITCLGMVDTYIRLAHLIYKSDMVGMMIMAGGMTFLENAIFMLFYMGFVRRIRAGIMWSGSILCWFGRGMQKIVNNWYPSVRILIAFSVHIVITLAMVAVALWTWNSNRIYSFLVLLAYLLLCGIEAVISLREGIQRNMLIDGIKRIAAGDLQYKVDTTILKNDNKIMGEAVNTIGEGLYHAVADNTKNERMKANLITNVSHDIKTPLTSIINYVDLLKREDLENERVKNYINVLDMKSQRLKQLTEDLVEASKISSGNITLQMQKLDFVELVYQTAGEFNEKFEARGLTAVTKMPKEPVIIVADGRRIWRVIENLYNNVAKYAMEDTRVYVDMQVDGDVVTFSIKNISSQPLNIGANELTERFIRGDVSRSTEGSGLGLSIAQNLTKLMGGTFDIYLDGDLFKATVTFLVVKGEG